MTIIIMPYILFHSIEHLSFTRVNVNVPTNSVSLHTARKICIYLLTYLLKCQGTFIAHFCSTEPVKRLSYASCLMGLHSFTCHTHVLYPQGQSKTGWMEA